MNDFKKYDVLCYNRTGTYQRYEAKLTLKQENQHHRITLCRKYNKLNDLYDFAKKTNNIDILADIEPKMDEIWSELELCMDKIKANKKAK